MRDGESVRERDRTDAPPLPYFGFMAWGVVLALYSSAVFTPVPTHPAAIALVAFTAAWWVVAVLLARGLRSALVPALALIVGLALTVLALEVRRTVVVLGGGEVEAEYGVAVSRDDLPFYWTLEGVLVFLPLCVIAVRLHAARRGASGRSP